MPANQKCKVTEIQYLFLQVGESVTFNCIAGYRIAGKDDNSITSAQLNCSGDSNNADWSEDRPDCERKQVSLYY